jgi:hypothetical protein
LAIELSLDVLIQGPGAAGDQQCTQHSVDQSSWNRSRLGCTKHDASLQELRQLIEMLAWKIAGTLYFLAGIERFST